jgi:hypothetical protein
MQIPKLFKRASPTAAQASSTYAFDAFGSMDVSAPLPDGDEDAWQHSPPITPEFAPIGQFQGARLDYPRLDLERSASVSTLASFNSTDEAAALFMTITEDVLSSQGNPIRDCAFSFYITQLKRALAYQPSGVANTPAHRALWRQHCATIGPDFFWARQDPTMADSPQASADAVKCLLDAHILQRPPRGAKAQDAWVRDYVTEEAVRAAATDAAAAAKVLLPPFLTYTVVGLNMAKDAGEFEFFELKDIYGFRALNNMELPNPFDMQPLRTTEQACKERSVDGAVTPQMLKARQERVAERKQTMQRLIEASEAEEMRRRANNFF